MRALRIGGRKVLCPYCKRRYASAPVFKTACCGSCLRALFVGVMVGRNMEADEIYKRYKLTRRDEEGKQ